MRAAAVPTLERPVPPPLATKAWPSLRLVPRLEANTRIVAFSQTALGKLVLLCVFALALRYLDNTWLLKTGLVSLMAFVPRFRRLLVLIGTILLTNFFWYENGVLAWIAVVPHSRQVVSIILPFVVLCAGLMWFVHKYRKSVLARRPLVCLLGIYAITLMTACYAPLDQSWRFTVWAFLLVFSNYFWFLAYAVSDSAMATGDPVAHQFGSFHPFWGSTTVPLPKGLSYWRRIEAKTPEDLAVTMIKGVKLILWCLLLSLVNHYFAFVHQKFGIPTLPGCITAFTQGKPYPLVISWLSIPIDILDGILSLSVWGHIVIATCRMAGFRALRNTYAPLSSQTVAEFWNRYYYYFKELLVDMLFYPTFIRFFKRNPAIRTSFATFVAVTVGVNLFHFMRDIHLAIGETLPRAIMNYPYVFYSVLLALGISISQIRSHQARLHRSWLRTHVWAPACVFGFYCLLHIFETSSLSVGSRYLAFLFLGR